MQELNIQNIIDLYNKKLSIRQIAKLNNCSRTKIKNCLKKQNINIRPYNKDKIYKNKVISLYKNNFTVKQITNNLDLSKSTVLKILHQNKDKNSCIFRSTGNTSSRWAGFSCIPSTFLTTLKHSAIARSIYFDLKIEDIYNLYIEQEKKCKLSNIDLFFGSTKIKTDKRNTSVDRINSDLFYTKDNIQLVDVKVNYMKYKFSLSHFYDMCNLVVNPADNYSDYVFDKEINVNLIFRTSQKRAKDKKIDFNINRSDLVRLYEKQNKKCAITNLPIEFKAEYRKPFFNQVSIDRINSDIGYIKSNIQLVIKDINFMKHKLDLNEFKDLCNKVINHKRSIYAID